MTALCAPHFRDAHDDRDLMRGRFPYYWALFGLFVLADLVSTIAGLATL